MAAPKQKFYILNNHNNFQKFLSFGDKSILVYHTGQIFKKTFLDLMAAKSLTTSLKSMEETTLFSIERAARFVNLSCDIADRRYNLISFILLKERSHDATETGNVNSIRRAVAKVLYASNPIDEMYLSNPFGEKCSYSPFCFAL
jgi:hypothetical protein